MQAAPIKLPPTLARLAGWIFSRGVLGAVRLGARLSPEAIWPPLERLALQGARGCARLARPYLVHESQHPLRAAMRFVDLAERLVGIEGDWEIIDGRRAVRRVHSCPHAAGLRQTPEFCTRIGLQLGQGLAQALVDSSSIRFSLHSTLSQGQDCCEYRLTID